MDEPHYDSSKWTGLGRKFTENMEPAVIRKRSHLTIIGGVLSVIFGASAIFVPNVNGSHTFMIMGGLMIANGLRYVASGYLKYKAVARELYNAR